MNKREKTSVHSQRGFLMVTAVVLIVIAALILSVMVYLSAAGHLSTARNLSAKQALFIAGSGLERGIHALLVPVLNERLSCGAVTGDVNLTNVAFGNGRFTVTAGASSYPASATMLKIAINATDNTIPVINPSGYVGSGGRVLIDREAIDYSGVESSDDAICGGAGRAPCLIGAQRGRDDTTAASHAGGTPLGQYQCDLQSRGGVPDFVNIRGERTVQEGVQLQEGWAVGDSNGNNFTFVRWNQPVETQWSNASFTDAANRVNLNAVSMLSYADGWAVGDSRGNNFMLVRRTGAGWAAQPLTDSANRANLNGVYCVLTNDCWAVGDSNGNNFTFVRRTGAGWAAQPLTDNANRANLNDVYCVSSNDCWAVGDRNGGRFTFVQRTVTGWTARPVSSNARANLYGVHCVSTSDCAAVGQSRGGGSNRWTFQRWNGAAWNRVTVNTSGTGARDLYSVTLLDTNGDNVSDDGWAVGARSGGGTNGWILFRWNHPAANTWNLFPLNTSGTGAQDLYAVDCATANDCWATGNAGMLLHWDGSGWSHVAVAGVTQALWGVSVISHHQLPQSAWREVFP